MSMVAINVALLAAAAEQETRREAVLKQLREVGATGPSSAVELHLDGEEAGKALGELVAAGKVKDVGGRFYVEPEPKTPGGPHAGFFILLFFLVTVSIILSFVAVLTM